MGKGSLLYEKMREYLVIYEEALSHTVYCMTFYSIPFKISQFFNSVLALGIEQLTASKEKVDVTLPAQFTRTADTV